MRKKIIFFIVVVIVCLVAWGLYMYNKPRTDVSKQKAAITIDAGKLYNQYAANESQANILYLDKIIAVTGNVIAINNTDSTINLLLGNSEDMNGISCGININSDKALQVKQNDKVTVKGKCTGFLNDVMLTDCVIEK